MSRLYVSCVYSSTLHLSVLMWMAVSYIKVGPVNASTVIKYKVSVNEKSYAYAVLHNKLFTRKDPRFPVIRDGPHVWARRGRLLYSQFTSEHLQCSSVVPCLALL